VVVTDLSRAPVSAQSVLVAAFGLTRAEARIAVRLGGAGTLGDIAAGLGIRLSTARTLLGRALAKTGLHSQAELVRLVERLALVEPGASAR
jgi:DNA-binding CsgD family transcriptional regulator